VFPWWVITCLGAGQRVAERWHRYGPVDYVWLVVQVVILSDIVLEFTAFCVLLLWKLSLSLLLATRSEALFKASVAPVSPKSYSTWWVCVMRLSILSRHVTRQSRTSSVQLHSWADYARVVSATFTDSDRTICLKHRPITVVYFNSCVTCRPS